MGFLRTVLLCGGLSFLALSARADIFVEPYLGYEMGKMNVTTTANQTWSTNDSGLGLGAWLGYSFPLMFVALDYEYASLPTSGASGPGALQDSTATRSSLGLIVGAKIPMFRGYVGYGFLDSFTLAPASGNASFNGSSIKIGGSYTGLPFVCLNLEYNMSTYSTYPSNDNAATNNGWLASVSLPYEF